MRNSEKYYFKTEKEKMAFENKTKRNHRVKSEAFEKLVNCSVHENGHRYVHNEYELAKAKKLYKDIFETTEEPNTVKNNFQRVSITLLMSLLAFLASKHLFVTYFDWILAGLIYFVGIFAPIVIDSVSHQYASEKAKCDQYIANMTLGEYNYNVRILKPEK